jgi:hypothetical protein
MELMKIVGNDTPGLFQRVLVELGRRKIDVEKSFMARSNGLITIIVEANTGNMNGRLLHALAQGFPHVRGGFLHVPYTPQQAAVHGEGVPCIPLEDMVRGIEAAIGAI